MVTKQDVKDIVEADNRVLGTIFRVELAETNNRIDTIAQDTKELKHGQERLEQKLDKRVEVREERIEQLEAANLLHKH